MWGGNSGLQTWQNVNAGIDNKYDVMIDKLYLSPKGQGRSYIASDVKDVITCLLGKMYKNNLWEYKNNVKIFSTGALYNSGYYLQISAYLYASDTIISSLTPNQTWWEASGGILPRLC